MFSQQLTKQLTKRTFNPTLMFSQQLTTRTLILSRIGFEERNQIL